MAEGRPYRIPAVLADDIELIQEQLAAFAGYNFAGDVASRMRGMKLSRSALAARTFVSHAAVGKWLNKDAKPHGKERFKELGMALGMNEAQLNAFLRANCYPRLYAKNPLDLACRFVLAAHPGSADIVERYRGFLEQYGLNEYILKDNPENIDTALLSMDFANVRSAGSFEQWLVNNDRRFRAFDKAYIPNAELIRFILLYIGEQSINDMFVAGELSVTIRNLLYPLIADKEIAVKGLRAKLIVFGLYYNMAEDEIDIMLDMAKLQPVSEPLTKTDSALLTALRCAHERYPYYELHNAESVLRILNEEESLRAFYKEKARRAADSVRYYEAEGHKSESERQFEETYTDYAGSGIMRYVADIFLALVRGGILSETETNEYTPLMQAYRDDRM